MPALIMATVQSQLIRAEVTEIRRKQNNGAMLLNQNKVYFTVWPESMTTL